MSNTELPIPSPEEAAAKSGVPALAEEYGADKIKVLEGLAAVRKRPAMYIGSTGPLGLHHLVYEIVDNSIDEALGGFCRNVHVTIHIDHSVTVIDDGRGIPTDMHESGRSAAEVVLTVLHAGGKFENSAYKVSGGLHGVGVSVVNALSEWLELEIWRNGHVHQQRYERGVPTGDLYVTGTTEKRGTKITFKPDTDIFETLDFSFETLSQRLRELAFLNAGLNIVIDDERDGKRHEFFYEGGISEFVEFLNKNKIAINDAPIFMTGERDGTVVDIALQWNDGYLETTYTFANNINTTEGGTHLSGFRAALTRTINNYATRNNLTQKLSESISGDDVREGMTAVVSVKIPAAAVRRADEDEARQYRGERHRRGHRQRPAGSIPRREPGGCQAHHHESRRGGARARGGAQGPRPRSTQGRARQHGAAGQAGRLPGARSRQERALHRGG